MMVKRNLIQVFLEMGGYTHERVIHFQRLDYLQLNAILAICAS